MTEERKDGKVRLSRNEDTSTDSDRTADEMPKSVNGQQLTIEYPPGISDAEYKIIQDSDHAYAHLKTTWDQWKKLRAGFVLLRTVAMRETHTDDVNSKLYKDGLHELLQQRAYRDIKPATRKALFACEKRAPEIDDWHDRLPDNLRLKLNHPANVLKAYLADTDKQSRPKEASSPNRQARHEAQAEESIKNSAAAMATKDAYIQELQTRTAPKLRAAEKIAAKPDIGDLNETTENQHSATTDSIIRYVIEKCGSAENIRTIVDALNAYLERAAT